MPAAQEEKMMKSSLSDNNMEKIRQVEKARQSALRKLAARERTEKEIMEDMGYLQIFDSGMKRYVWKRNEEEI